MAGLTPKDHQVLTTCFERAEGKAWEPKNPNHPFLERAIEAGYLRRVDGRCGYELFHLSMVTWTEAGRIAMEASA
jgi:hypothetical protein